MHIAMAMVGDGRTEAGHRHLGALEARARQGGANGMMTRLVGLPVAQAIYAFGAGKYSAAVELLAAARPNANRFGGSNAQRDVIALTLLEAALRGGQAALARDLTSERTTAKPHSPFAWHASARALDLLGDGSAADRARARAARA